MLALQAWRLEFESKTQVTKPGKVAHAYNPSIVRSRDKKTSEAH